MIAAIPNQPYTGSQSDVPSLIDNVQSRSASIDIVYDLHRYIVV